MKKKKKKKTKTKYQYEACRKGKGCTLISWETMTGRTFEKRAA